MTLSPESLRILQALSIRTKRSFYGTRYGSHRSLRRGHGIEFAEYRTYEAGDNPRSIDWNLYGRSDKLYSKRYLEEENVVVYLVIDGSHSIMHPALREKWECVQCIALATSFVALASHDTVVLSILGEKQVKSLVVRDRSIRFRRFSHLKRSQSIKPRESRLIWSDKCRR